MKGGSLRLQEIKDFLEASYELDEKLSNLL